MVPKDTKLTLAIDATPSCFMTARDEGALRARHCIARRLLPFLFGRYVVAFLDHLDLGTAALQMPRGLGWSGRAMGIGGGIFLLGYFLLEIPGELIAEHWSARRWIPRIMVSWGILTVVMAFIHTAPEFYLVRLLVGALEASFFPAVIVYLTHCFRTTDRAKTVAGFYAGCPFLRYGLSSRRLPARTVLAGLERLAINTTSEMTTSRSRVPGNVVALRYRYL